jgi:hypothetical protein
MPLLRVALRRMRCQPIDPFALFVAVLAGCALIGAVSIVAALGREDATRAELGSLAPAQRSVRVQVAFDPSVSPVDRAERRAIAGLAPLRDLTGRLTLVRVWGPVEPTDERGTRLVSIGGARPELVNGRAARGCSGTECEVLALGPRPKVGSVLAMPGVRLLVVGRARLPAGAQPSSAVLRGKAVVVPDAAPLAAVVAGVRRFSVITTPLDAGAIRGSRLGETADLIDRTLTRVHQNSQPSIVSSPVAELRRLDRRITTSQRRLLVIGIDGAALLIAFAAFFASTRRDQVALSGAQLAGLGASRRQLAAWRLVETGVPAAAGLLLAFAGVLAAAALYAHGRDLGSPFIGSALPLATVAAMVGIAFGASVVVLAWARPRTAAPARAGALEVGACVALAVIVWQAASTGGLDPDTLAGSGDTVPVMLFVPALAVLAFGVVLLRLLPFGYRLLERAARRGAPPVRLGLLGTVRHPRLAGAATTFLAVSLGTALFALNYRSTLVADAHAGASFRAGAAWRVTERSERPPATSSVAPLTRYRKVTHESPLPVLRLSGALDATGGPSAADIEVLGVPAPRLRELRGWRPSFSNDSPAEIGRAIARPGARFTGPRIAPTATAIRMWARSPSSNQLSVHVLERGQHFDELPLGSADLGWRLTQARVPPAARGATLAAVSLASNAFGATARTADFGPLEQRLGDGRWVRLADLGSWEGPVGGFSNSSVVPAAFRGAPIRRGATAVFDPAAASLIRPPFLVPGAIPALVGPDVGNGRVDLHIAGFRLPLIVVAHSKLFPTVTARPRKFVVVDYGTLFAYLNGGLPGIAEPSEAWFFGRPPKGASAVLERAPFRAAALTEQAALDRAAANDALALNARDLLTALAVVAALLGIVGFAVALGAIARDERQELAEYEALGVGPNELDTALRIRVAAMAGVGLVAAVAGGLAGNALTAGLVAVSGSGRKPLPPIEAHVAWLACAGVLVAVGLAAAAVTTRRARRSTVPVARRLREG